MCGVSPVLLVEDHEDLREATACMLEESDFSVVQAENGLQALERLQEFDDRPKAILLDLMMPIMNGWEFLEELNKHPRFSDVPVVVLSAVDYEWPDAANVICHMVKPATSDRLINELRKACCPASLEAAS